MDGVLCNLYESFFKIHGQPNLSTLMPLDKLHELFNSKGVGYWDPIMAEGWQFWADLEPFPWVPELWQWANDQVPVTICSRPLAGRDFPDDCTGDCVRGKQAWLRGQFGDAFEEIVYTRRKHLVSQPGVVLIDDDDTYVDAFKKNGGRVITFPQPYNSAREHAADPLAYVKQQFESLLEKPSKKGLHRVTDTKTDPLRRCARCKFVRPPFDDDGRCSACAFWHDAKHVPGPPPAPWSPCPSCEDYWCEIHKMHAHDCPCPPVEEWVTSPYSQPRWGRPYPSTRRPTQQDIDNATSRRERFDLQGDQDEWDK